MIIEGVIDLYMRIILGVFDTISLVPLPVALVDVLFDFFCYGTWVIGADFMVIFWAAIMFWMSIRFTVGLTVFLWELLPLT